MPFPSNPFKSVTERSRNTVIPAAKEPHQEDYVPKEVNKKQAKDDVPQETHTSRSASTENPRALIDYLVL
ncbi:hypothetical protein BJV82DRAFT_605547, partial [Fennellomyces sp. T-0311]